ncbi:MAG TPA: potassium-transporting ATPase subunit KdpC [Moraxellaceae bacterium]
MKSIMNNFIRPAVGLFAGLTLVTGLLYPLAVTGIAQTVFPTQANGSLIKENGTVIGSTFIGQPFTQPAYFWSRPSATASSPYNGMASGGSNLSTGNPALREAVAGRIAELKKYPVPAGPVPVDLVTASGSGLDPHISPAAALYQLPRVAAARGLDPAILRRLVQAHSEMPSPRFSGEPRVNVLALNRALDTLTGSRPATPAASGSRS